MGKYLFYAIRKGHTPGIYESYEEYIEQIRGYSHFEAKGFFTREDAEHFMKSGGKTNLYYAVRRGRHPGIYMNLEDFREEVEYAKFERLEDAEAYMEDVKLEEEEPPSPPLVQVIREITAHERLLRMLKGLKDLRRELIHSAKLRMSVENTVRASFCSTCKFSPKCRDECSMDATFLEVSIQLSALQKEANRILKEEKFQEVLEQKEEDAKEKEIVGEGCAVFTDGSSAHGCFGWAFVVYQENRQIHGESGNGKNPKGGEMEGEFAETKAVMEAVAWMQKAGIKAATVFYDSTQLEKFPNGEDTSRNITLQSYLEWMKEHTKGLVLSFSKVRAHTGVTGNEVVDQMAKDALWREIMSCS